MCAIAVCGDLYTVIRRAAVEKPDAEGISSTAGPYSIAIAILAITDSMMMMACRVQNPPTALYIYILPSFIFALLFI